MNETPSTAPLDLSMFDDPALPPPAPAAALPVPVAADLAPQPRPARLVEVANLAPDELAAAQAQAAQLDFT